MCVQSNGKVLAIIALISFIYLGGIEAINPFSRIDSNLLKSLEKTDSVNILIEMTEGTSTPLEKVRSEKYVSQDKRVVTLAKLLQSHAKNSQYLLKSFLEEVGVKYKSFWISNQIYIPGASLHLVKQLATFDQVAKIFEEPIVKLEIPTLSKDSIVKLPNTPRAPEWGVSKIQADLVWGLVGGTTGEGIVIGGIDTGVRSTHQDLRANFRSSYGWRDPVTESELPYDDGFGTHQMGILAGANGIGISPGSQWISCKGCGPSSCLSSHLIECGQFMMCPTLPDGSSPDCSQAANVVSNSWGGVESSWFDPVIEAWIAAGIVPFFPIGSHDNTCSSVGSPADGNVLAIGSTTIDDSLSQASSHGPNSRGEIKPEVSAPGVNIVSASAVDDDAYVTLSGTRMASNHAAGTGALILSARLLPYEELKAVLLNNSDTTGLSGPGANCGGIPETEFPNNAFGYGRVNAFKSVLFVISSHK